MRVVELGGETRSGGVNKAWTLEACLDLAPERQRLFDSLIAVDFNLIFRQVMLHYIIFLQDAMKPSLCRVVLNSAAENIASPPRPFGPSAPRPVLCCVVFCLPIEPPVPIIYEAVWCLSYSSQAPPPPSFGVRAP